MRSPKSTRNFPKTEKKVALVFSASLYGHHVRGHLRVVKHWGVRVNQFGSHQEVPDVLRPSEYLDNLTMTVLPCAGRHLECPSFP